MSPLAGLTMFASVGIEPLLSMNVPGCFEGLQPSTGKGDQKLPQGIVPDDALNKIRFATATCALGADEQLPAVNTNRRVGQIVAHWLRLLKGGLVGSEINLTFGQAMV